jgi:diguanylate cyclase (GGDEF)-like protein
MQHVVLVDDAATNLEILSAIVGDIPDVEVHAFTSSREALAWCKEHEVNAFVLDYRMPEPDGLALIRILRADSAFALVPIVIITAEHEFEVRLEALAAGANDFLERPIERREVISRVRTLLSLEAARTHLAEQVGALEHSLEREARRARLQAERLAALWRVANASSNLSNEETIQAVLNEAAAAIRPGQMFFGSLMRYDDDHFVLLAGARPDKILNDVPNIAPIGTHIQKTQLPHHLAINSAMTLSWDDLSTDPALAALPLVRKLRVRAQICTPFEVERKKYLLTFASREPAHDPFAPEDHTYLNLVADFFANHFRHTEHSHRITHHLSHDTLTGLRNRTQFRLDARLRLAGAGSGAIVVVSLDGFRGINAEFGHINGDALLVEVGAALALAVGDHGIVGRLAGDTFGAFLTGLTSGDDLRARLGTLKDVFTRPFSTGDREGREFIPVGATLGAALATGTAESIDRLLAHADAAVFAAKQRGRGNVEIYVPGMESAAGNRARTSLEISQALERNEFELYFQPHVDARTLAVTGAEALIRWNHPERGLVLPDAFIPFAEQHGLIRPITRWVMRAALAASKELRAGDPAFRLYFNLSALDFSDAAIVDEFRRAAADGTSLANIGIELTESVAMADLGTAARIVQHLQNLDVRVAIDDFGTGFSSLVLLRRVPANIVKIDQSFVAEVLLDHREAAIAETIIASGRQLGYETIAEGVESEEQLTWLRERGCRYVQGYAIARPQPLGAFLEWMTERGAAVRPVA